MLGTLRSCVIPYFRHVVHRSVLRSTEVHDASFASFRFVWWFSQHRPFRAPVLFSRTSRSLPCPAFDRSASLYTSHAAFSSLLAPQDARAIRHSCATSYVESHTRRARRHFPFKGRRIRVRNRIDPRSVPIKPTSQSRMRTRRTREGEETHPEDDRGSFFSKREKKLWVEKVDVSARRWRLGGGQMEGTVLSLDRRDVCLLAMRQACTCPPHRAL